MERCTAPRKHTYCTKATGPFSVAIQRVQVRPDIHNNASVLAYGEPCFLHSNYTVRCNNNMSRRKKRFFFALLFSAIMGGIVESSMKSALDAQMDKYNDILNKRLGALANEMNAGFNRVEKQIADIRENEAKLQHEVALMARYTSFLAGREINFETQQYAFDKEILQQATDNSRAILQNRQSALAAGKKQEQQAIIDYHLLKRVLMLLEELNPVPGLENNTIYRNEITRGLVKSKALYWFGKNLSHFYEKWGNAEEIQRVRQDLAIQDKQQIRLQILNETIHEEVSDRYGLMEIINATLSPIEIINFNITWNPIAVEFVNPNWTGGAGRVLRDVLQFGGKIADDVSGVVNNVVDKGVDVIEHTEDTVSGFFSKPIQIIIIAVSSVIGLIIMLVMGSCAWRYAKTGKTPNPEKALKLAAAIGGVTPLRTVAALGELTTSDNIAGTKA